MVTLQKYHQTLSLRAPTHSSASVASASAPEPAPAAAAAAALSRCRQLQQLFGALAVVRRTAECLCTLGVRVAYLYLNHMLEQMPRRVNVLGGGGRPGEGGRGGICALGIRVAYLYLNHMLKQIPR